MADIDLIPADYRASVMKRSMLAKFTAIIVAVNVVLLALGLFLAQSAAATREHSSQVKMQHAISDQQKNQLQQLTEQQSEYRRQWSLLRGLRAGASIAEIFTMIDRSIGDGQLWFDEWSFQRAGVIVDGEQRGVETGYFVVIDDAEASDAGLSIETHMTISGHAVDHQALSKFVRALFEQQEVQDVSVLKTAKTSYANGAAVTFDLTIVLNSEFSES